jgi:hypothetical protein
MIRPSEISNMVRFISSLLNRKRSYKETAGVRDL